VIDEEQVVAKVAAANPVVETTSMGAEEGAEARRVLERVLGAPDSVRPVREGQVRRPSRPVGWLASALGVMVALAVVVVALVSLKGHTNPSAAAVPGRQQLIRIISVLRRPQTKADLEAEKLPVFRNPGPITTLGAPDIPLIRYATTTPWGEKLYFIPFKPPTASELSRSRLPAPAIRARRRRGETLGVFSSHGGAGGGTAQTIEAGRGMETEGVGRAFNEGSTETRIILVVPDGVARVTFVLPRQPDRGNPYAPVYSHSSSVTVAVRDNIAAVQVNRDCCGPQTAIIWYAANGRVIKTIGNPTSANQVIPPPKPGPETALSRAAERNPATPNRVWVTPSVGGPHSSYTLHFHVLLNHADYNYRYTGPYCPTIARMRTHGGGLFTAPGTDLRGTTWKDPLVEGPPGSRTWCPGTYHISVAVEGFKPNGDFEFLARPFGTATFTVRR
jgi:hypothetical protein